MDKTHPKLWLAYLLLVLTAQTGVYRYYLRSNGAATVMLLGFFLIPAFALVAGQIGLYLGLGIAVLLTVAVVRDLFLVPNLVREAHSREVKR
ncbi:hypothetical protein N9L47_13075 [Rhodobacteraceae bacterium]|nr:hypothetical protein [Paracoccaceae bacterium]